MLLKGPVNLHKHILFLFDLVELASSILLASLLHVPRQVRKTEHQQKWTHTHKELPVINSCYQRVQCIDKDQLIDFYFRVLPPPEASHESVDQHNQQRAQEHWQNSTLLPHSDHQQTDSQYYKNYSLTAHHIPHHTQCQKRAYNAHFLANKAQAQHSSKESRIGDVVHSQKPRQTNEVVDKGSDEEEPDEDVISYLVQGEYRLSFWVQLCDRVVPKPQHDGTNSSVGNKCRAYSFVFASFRFRSQHTHHQRMVLEELQVLQQIHPQHLKLVPMLSLRKCEVIQNQPRSAIIFQASCLHKSKSFDHSSLFQCS